MDQQPQPQKLPELQASVETAADTAWPQPSLQRKPSIYRHLRKSTATTTTTNMTKQSHQQQPRERIPFLRFGIIIILLVHMCLLDLHFRNPSRCAHARRLVGVPEPPRSKVTTTTTGTTAIRIRGINETSSTTRTAVISTAKTKVVEKEQQEESVKLTNDTTTIRSTIIERHNETAESQ